MADNTLNAAIEITADATGMKVGIGQALAQLESMKKSVGSILGNTAVAASMQSIQWLYDNAVEHINELRDASQKFSSAGANGAAREEAAKLAGQVEMGRAFGPTSEALSNQQALAEAKRAKYMSEHAKDFATQAAMEQSFANSYQEVKDRLAVGFAQIVDQRFGTERPLETQMINQVPMMGPMMGLSYDLYVLIRDKLGGN